MGFAIGVVKYLVFVVNLIFALFGFAIFIYGIVHIIQYKDQATFAPIIFGVIVFLIAFFGCCGAIRENRCMLITFAVILIALFVISLIFGGVLINAGSVYDECFENVTGIYDNYRHGTDKEEWITYQKENKCCGFDGPNDYNTTILPPSCCETNKIECTKDDPDYPVGCALICSIEFVLFAVGIVIILIGLIEIIGSILAICLARSIQSQSRKRLFV